MEKLKELECRVDRLLELKSRDRCLQELYSFAVERLGLYRGMVKDKDSVALLDLLSDDDSSMDEAVKFYMVDQYYGFCQYINGCMDDLNHEWEEIGHKNGYFKANPDEKP